MSTRCQIQFIENGEKITVYRHSDGYPLENGYGVLPDLQEFFKWNNRLDLEYCVANFIYWSKKQYSKYSEFLGFGICPNNCIHGDIEYYYIIDLTELEISVYNVPYDKFEDRKLEQKIKLIDKDSKRVAQCYGKLDLTTAFGD